MANNLLIFGRHIQGCKVSFKPPLISRKISFGLQNYNDSICRLGVDVLIFIDRFNFLMLGYEIFSKNRFSKKNFFLFQLFEHPLIMSVYGKYKISKANDEQLPQKENIS